MSFFRVSKAGLKPSRRPASGWVVNNNHYLLVLCLSLLIALLAGVVLTALSGAGAQTANNPSTNVVRTKSNRPHYITYHFHPKKDSSGNPAKGALIEVIYVRNDGVRQWFEGSIRPFDKVDWKYMTANKAKDCYTQHPSYRTPRPKSLDDDTPARYTYLHASFRALGVRRVAYPDTMVLDTDSLGTSEWLCVQSEPGVKEGVEYLTRKAIRLPKPPKIGLRDKPQSLFSKCGSQVTDNKSIDSLDADARAKAMETIKENKRLYVFEEHSLAGLCGGKHFFPHGRSNEPNYKDGYISIAREINLLSNHSGLLTTDTRQRPGKRGVNADKNSFLSPDLEVCHI